MLQVSLSLSLSLSLKVPNIMPCIFYGLPNIIIPGGKIPKWLSLECQGGNIGVSFRGCDDLIGIALCIVLVPIGSQVSQLTFDLYINEFKIAHFVQYLRSKYGKVESPLFVLSIFRL